VKDRFFLKFRKFGENRIALFLKPVKNERNIRMPIQRLGSAGDDNLGTKVATHEVERYSDHASLILLSAEGRNFGQNTGFGVAYN
jgi:hypothetical protein